MSGTDYLQTPNLQLFKPIYDHDVEMWGTHLNANADTLDAALGPRGPLMVTATTGFVISGNGDPATRGAHVSRIYIHGCTNTAFTVTYACRQVVIDGLRAYGNGLAANATYPAVFLDASECVADCCFECRKRRGRILPYRACCRDACPAKGGTD